MLKGKKMMGFLGLIGQALLLVLGLLLMLILLFASLGKELEEIGLSRWAGFGVRLAKNLINEWVDFGMGV